MGASSEVLLDAGGSAGNIYSDSFCFGVVGAWLITDDTCKGVKERVCCYTQRFERISF